MKTFFENFIKQHLTQEISSTLSYCEFDCRRLTCENCPLNVEENLSKQ